MVRLHLEEVRHEKQLLLDKFAEFCEEHNLHYTLAYGTLLGAIRDKGWIPWDDDVDVAMLREDWNRFFSLYSNEDNSRFKVVNNVINPDVHTKIGYIYDEFTHMKPRNSTEFIGFNAIQIDIYPIDCIPSGRIQQKLFINHSRLLCWMAKLADIPGGNPGGNRSIHKIVLATFINFIMRPMNANWFIALLRKHNDKYNRKFSTTQKMNGMVNMLCTTEIPRPIVPYKTYTEFIKVEYNGKEYSAVKNYDGYLRARYGDYMSPPSAEQRECHTYNSEEYYIDDEYYIRQPQKSNPYAKEW